MTPLKSFVQHPELQEALPAHLGDERDLLSFAHLAALEQDLSDLGWDHIGPDEEYVWMPSEWTAGVTNSDPSVLI